MQSWIILFRGINVGGNNIVPMAELRALMTEIGFEGAQTYIQSGNLVLQADRGAADITSSIASAVEEKFGFKPHLMVLSLADFGAAINANPFPEAVADPKTLHLFFTAETSPTPDMAAMEKWKTESETFKLIDTVFYLHAPDGIGRSKLAARVERLLGVDTTARNWRSALKIQELARGL